MRLPVLAAAVPLVLLSACKRGPQYCIFDGTFIGAAPQPFVALNPDLTVDGTPNRYTWREFVWPTDPAWNHVRPDRGAWLFEGSTGGTPWTFRGTFAADAGGFVRLESMGNPPPVQVVGSNGKPTLLLYRVRPCREFEGSKTGVRTCTKWASEVNARTKLTCE